eukprot:GEMP01060001.1.p1 GENE.GEMP01060001.1~~GEMP01060001.1.p1  ORF type:complete len:240 (+),score=48.94 GEMP01060001.1:298-1017(+)
MGGQDSKNQYPVTDPHENCSHSVTDTGPPFPIITLNADYQQPMDQFSGQYGGEEAMWKNVADVMRAKSAQNAVGRAQMMAQDTVGDISGSDKYLGMPGVAHMAPPLPMPSLGTGGGQFGVESNVTSGIFPKGSPTQLAQPLGLLPNTVMMDNGAYLGIQPLDSGISMYNQTIGPSVNDQTLQPVLDSKNTVAGLKSTGMTEGLLVVAAISMSVVNAFRPKRGKNNGESQSAGTWMEHFF